MLVVSRRIDEDVLIGDNIVVKIIDIYYGKVRLGIKAPKDVKIFRRELLEGANKQEGPGDGKPGADNQQDVSGKQV